MNEISCDPESTLKRLSLEKEIFYPKLSISWVRIPFTHTNVKKAKAQFLRATEDIARL